MLLLILDFFYLNFLVNLAQNYRKKKGLIFKRLRNNYHIF